MARSRSITVSVLALSLFFALASARVPLDPTEDGARTLHGSTDLLESDPKTTTTTLLLPSDPEPETAAEIEPDQVREPWIPDPNELEAINNNREASSLEAQTAPLRPMKLRPINRHFFPKRPLFVRRGCHHHGDPMVKPWAPREHLSYGNDMVLEGTGEGGEKMMGREERQLDGRFQSVARPRFWIVRPIEVRPRGDGERREEDDEMTMLRPHHHHHHHHHDEDEDRREDAIDRDHDHHREHEEEREEDDEMTMLRPHHHHHGRHHDEDEDRREDAMDRDHHHHHHEHEDEEMGGRGIFHGVRKFLDHF